MEKLSYEKFKEEVVEHILEYLPEEYQNKVPEIKKVEKVNLSLDGLLFKDKNPKGGFDVSPTVYLEDFYERYLEEFEFEYTLRVIADIFTNSFSRAETLNEKYPLDAAWDNVREHIILQLINTAQNQSLLANIPHREFFDLSVIYKWIIEDIDEGVVATIVNDKEMDMWEVSESDLYGIALENMKRMYPSTIQTMEQVIFREIVRKGRTGVQLSAEECMMAELLLDKPIPEKQQLLILSNERGYRGASVMLDKDILHEVSERFDSSFYILPSSVHEVLAASTESHSLEDIREMVLFNNFSDETPLSDRLSNNIYLYDRDSEEVTQVTSSKIGIGEEGR